MTTVDPKEAPEGYRAVLDVDGADSCEKCALNGRVDTCSGARCLASDRMDNSSVIFVKDVKSAEAEDVRPDHSDDLIDAIAYAHAGAMESAGKKFDLGKPRLELLDRYALEQTALVLNFGADKYAAWNWAEGIQYSRLIGAALRHIEAYNDGEDLDPESGLPHTAHASCCLMFLLGMSRRHPEMDDRYKFEVPK
jgi:hypothetical protein